MPEISRFFGIVIRMYYEDHNPPHFHAIYQEYAAEFNIHTLKVIRGSLPARAESLVVEWATLHQAELLEDWLLTLNHKQINPIAPLI